MAEAKKNGWGGKRAGAGRRPGAVDGTERKMSINRGQIPKVREKAIYLSS